MLLVFVAEEGGFDGGEVETKLFAEEFDGGRVKVRRVDDDASDGV